MSYLTWNTKTITDFSDTNINSLYSEGNLFGRTGKGEMYQTRSLRIDLSKFKLSSENRRVLRKTENIILNTAPLPYTQYNWSIGKLAKDFYNTKFGDKTFSANKIKELMTEARKSNFNVVITYTVGAWHAMPLQRGDDVGEIHELPPHNDDNTAGVQNYEPPQQQPIGYTICLETNQILHYCYPFYQLSNIPNDARANINSPLHGDIVGVQNFEPLQLPANVGIGMMLKAIVWAKENGKKYIYLGSFSRPTDTYKLQFEGLEWWNGNEWLHEIQTLKNIFL